MYMGGTAGMISTQLNYGKNETIPQRVQEALEPSYGCLDLENWFEIGFVSHGKHLLHMSATNLILRSGSLSHLAIFLFYSHSV